MQVITKKEDNGVLVICLNGRLDANTSAGVEKQINDFINAGEARLIINFKGVDYINQQRRAESIGRHHKTTSGEK